jgi:hypothetical protein
MNKHQWSNRKAICEELGISPEVVCDCKSEPGQAGPRLDAEHGLAAVDAAQWDEAFEKLLKLRGAKHGRGA